MIKRTQWQNPAQPVTGPAPKGKPGTWVIHYPGMKGPAPYGYDVVTFLRNVQNDYLVNRGYSIGYNWGVSQDGAKWEIRGNDFNNAANAGRKVSGNFNNISQSIFVMVSGDDPATVNAVRSINEIIATRPDWDVIWHGKVDYTSCAGAGLISQIMSGVIGHQKPIDNGGHSVFQKLIRLDGTLAVYAVYSGGYKVWVRNEGERAAFEALGAKEPEVISANLRSLFAITGPIFGPRPAGVDSHGLPL